MRDFKPTASQKAAIEARGGAVLVSAGAGSGKTRVLTERLEGYLEEGKILSRDLTCAKVGDTLMVTLSAECEEQIGKLVDMPAEDGEGR